MSIGKKENADLHSFGFTGLPMSISQRSLRQLESFCAVHLDPVTGRIFGPWAALFFPVDRILSRDQGHFLFSEITYQLALNTPGLLRQHFNRIILMRRGM